MGKIKKINFKKLNLTIVLAIIVAILAIITLLMPSRDKVKEIEVKKDRFKKIEKNKCNCSLTCNCGYSWNYNSSYAI